MWNTSFVVKWMHTSRLFGVENGLLEELNRCMYVDHLNCLVKRSVVVGSNGGHLLQGVEWTTDLILNFRSAYYAIESHPASLEGGPLGSVHHLPVVVVCITQFFLWRGLNAVWISIQRVVCPLEKPD